MAGVDVGQTPSEERYAESPVRLLRYKSPDSVRDGPPILLVYAVINRPYVLDLQPDRSVVRQFLDAGFDVYLLDWGTPSRLDTSLGLDDYVTRYLHNCVDAVRDQSGHESIHFLGYCTGGTLSAIYAALYPDSVRTLGLLAPVLYFETDDGILGRWGRTEYVDPQRVTDAFGNVPGDALGLEFSLQDPVEYHLARYLDLVDHLEDAVYLRHAARRLRWGFDTVDVAGTLYEQFLVNLYRNNELMRGELVVDGTTVDVTTIDVPVLDVVGRDDSFVPPAASRPFVEAVHSEDTQIVEFPTGHVGLSIGERAHAELWPCVREWYEHRSDGSTSLT